MAHDLVIVGGGPAGMMAGLLFARAGVKTLVLEKHRDFLRDFRGDTVHPSTLQIFHELGLLEEFLRRPHNKVEQLGARIAGQFKHVADFRHLPVAAPFIALMPQWDFLDFVAEKASRYPGFELRQSCTGESLIEEGGRVAGVRTNAGDEMRANLVIASDGRDSRFRAGFTQQVIGAPMDVFWFRLPKREKPVNDSMGVFDNGLIFVLIDRGDYWQCAYVIAKGRWEAIQAEGLPAFRARVLEMSPFLGRRVEALTQWSDVKLLSVQVDRLKRWWRPGFLAIGDAAHAMSPIGGVGVNLAVQDAVAAANRIAGPLRAGRVTDEDLQAIQTRREWAVRLTQSAQLTIQNRLIGPVLESQQRPKAPALLKLFNVFPVLRRLPALLAGLGARPEHVRTPEASPP